MQDEQAFYLSTGKAAKVLGMSADAVRRLCHAEQIEGAVVTPGGQWRVPYEEIERLKRDGIPPVPRPLPTLSRASRNEADGEDDEDSPGVGIAKSINGGRSYLLADPSEETIAAADSVVRLESEVRALELRKQKEQSLDWFRDRQADEEARAEEESDLEAAREAEEMEHQDRVRFQGKWLSYALSRIAPEFEGEGLEVRVHARVKDALSTLDTDEPDGIVERIVLGVVAATARPHRRRKEVEGAIEEAVGVLPYTAKSWEGRAREAAREAVERLGPEASMYAVQNAARGAVGKIIAQSNAARAAEDDAAERARLVQFIPLELRDFTERGRELALEAVAQAFAALPVGTPRERLIEARDGALAPFRAALVRQSEMRCAEAESRRREQAAALEAQLRRFAGPGPHHTGTGRNSRPLGRTGTSR